MLQRFKNIFGPIIKSQSTSDNDIIGSLLDAFASGDAMLDADGRGSGRDSALGYPALVRCATLLSSVVAQLITNGSMKVIDINGNIVKNQKAQKALMLFHTSLDGDVDAYTSVEDLVIDYALEGNALAKLTFSASGQISVIQKLDVLGAEINPTSNGGYVYRATQSFNPEINAIYETIDPRSIAHARLPILLGSSNANVSSRRSKFASSPVRLLNRALSIAIAGDKAIREYYKSGQRSNLGIAYPDKLSNEQLKDIRSAYVALQKTGAPFVVDRGAAFTNIQNSASNSDSLNLREFQVAEVSRIFGIPGPLLNQNLTSWGQGISELAKLAWRFGLSQHCERFLAPFSFRLLDAGQRFKVDASDLLRGDVADMARFLIAVKKDAQRGETMTVEEQRLFLGLPIKPVEGVLQDATNSAIMEDTNSQEQTDAQ